MNSTTIEIKVISNGYLVQCGACVPTKTNWHYAISESDIKRIICEYIDTETKLQK